MGWSVVDGAGGGLGCMGVRLVQYLILFWWAAAVVQVAPHEWVMGPLGGC